MSKWYFSQIPCIQSENDDASKKSQMRQVGTAISPNTSDLHTSTWNLRKSERQLPWKSQKNTPNPPNHTVNSYITSKHQKKERNPNPPTIRSPSRQCEHPLLNNPNTKRLKISDNLSSQPNQPNNSNNSHQPHHLQPHTISARLSQTSRHASWKASRSPQYRRGTIALRVDSRAGCPERRRSGCAGRNVARSSDSFDDALNGFGERPGRHHGGVARRVCVLR
jgi:hypothetical protein